MSARFTPEDVGKRVINEHGDDVGMVTDVEGATAYVEPDPGITDSIKAALGWGSPSDEAITLRESDVSDVTHTEVHLQSPGAMGAGDVDGSRRHETEVRSGMEAEPKTETGTETTTKTESESEIGTESDARRLDEREPIEKGPGSRETEPNRSEPDRARGIDEGHGRVDDEDTAKVFEEDEDLFDEGEGVFDDEESAVEPDSRSKTADQHHGGLARERDDEPDRERGADGRSVNNADGDSARKRKAEEMDAVSDSEGDLSEEEDERRRRGKRRSTEDEDDERTI